MAASNDSLYSTILHNYTYEEIRDLCFTEGEAGVPASFPIVFDCQWGIWRDKAVTDFNISPQFFDLVRVLSGPQRYLQIASYVKLSPLSGVRVYQDTGVIEGVYEALAGFSEARNRGDMEALLCFTKRIKPEQAKLSSMFPSWLSKEAFAEEISQDLAKRKDKILTYPPQDGVYNIDYLALVLEQGRVDVLDKILQYYFVLPQGFNIEKDIPYTPFWAEEFPIYDLPLQETPEEDFDTLVGPILSSGDTRIVDFFRSIFRDRDFNTPVRENFLSGYGSLLYHRKPEEAYGMDVRFFNKESYTGRGLGYDYMIESLLYALSHDEEPEDNDWIEDGHLGDIPFITAFLQLVPYKKETLLKLVNFPNLHVLYPLTIAILREHL
jgi:hypothetical protein